MRFEAYWHLLQVQVRLHYVEKVAIENNIFKIEDMIQKYDEGDIITTILVIPRVARIWEYLQNSDLSTLIFNNYFNTRIFLWLPLNINAFK